MSKELTKEDFKLFLAKGGQLKNTITLNVAQYNKLTKNQREEREPVIIMGKKGYVGEDRVWTSEEYMNNLKKQGKWKS